MEFLRLLLASLPLVAPLLVLAACCYYLVSRQALDAILLVVGSVIGLIMTAFFTYLPYFAQARAMSVNNMTSYYAIGGVVSLLGTMVFTAGLFILMEKVIKLTAKNNPEKRYY